MPTCELKTGDLFLYSAAGIVPFVLVSNAGMYRLTNRIFGGRLATADGAPNWKGVAVHSVAFYLVVVGLMALADAMNNKWKLGEAAKWGISIGVYVVLLGIAAYVSYKYRI